MIDVQQVRELIELMVEHDLSEIRVREGETAISLRKGARGVEVAAPPPASAYLHAPTAGVVGAEPAGGTVPAPEDEGLIPIPSPMVGTYYASPDPDSPPYVEIGSEIDEESPVCIIEAMKVFNEIKAEVAGIIEKVLVRDQQAVEFGQPLMLVRPRR